MEYYIQFVMIDWVLTIFNKVYIFINTLNICTYYLKH